MTNNQTRVSQNTAASTPGFDGMDARRRDEPIEACPYEPSPQRTAWVVGWYIAAPEKPHVR